MVDSLTLFGISRGIQTGSGIGDAFRQQAAAGLKADALQTQMDEIAVRTKMQSAKIAQKAERAVAEQTASFVSAGVEISGSAMSVLADTVSNAAEAAYIRQREAAYDMEVMAAEKGALDKAASNTTLLLNATAAGISGAGGYLRDEYQYGRRATRDVRPVLGES